MRARKTAALARLQGQRLTHLRAHLETRALLTADQIARYQQLRRYRHRATIITDKNRCVFGEHRRGLTRHKPVVL
jgi:hypothetical protein